MASQAEKSLPSFALRVCGLLLFPILLNACAGTDRASAPTQVQSPEVITNPAADMATEVVQPASPINTLTPLPTPQDVQAQVKEGRLDPFQPLAKPSSVDEKIEDKNGLKLHGVLIVGDKQRALMQTAAGSGAVCVGPGGLCPGQSEQLLPEGWSVIAIDIRRGCLTLAEGKKAQPPICMA